MWHTSIDMLQYRCGLYNFTGSATLLPLRLVLIAVIPSFWIVEPYLMGRLNIALKITTTFLTLDRHNGQAPGGEL
jgi:hypothetical protein